MTKASELSSTVAEAAEAVASLLSMACNENSVSGSIPPKNKYKFLGVPAAQATVESPA